MLRSIAFRLLVVIPCAASAVARAQDPGRTARRDSVRADSAARLKTVTIVATPAERVQPVSATRIDALSLRLTPANSTYELLRQTAGLEVHEQGQGPGF